MSCTIHRLGVQPDRSARLGGGYQRGEHPIARYDTGASPALVRLMTSIREFLPIGARRVLEPPSRRTSVVASVSCACPDQARWIAGARLPSLEWNLTINPFLRPQRTIVQAGKARFRLRLTLLGLLQQAEPPCFCEPAEILPRQSTAPFQETLASAWIYTDRASVEQIAKPGNSSGSPFSEHFVALASSPKDTLLTAQVTAASSQSQSQEGRAA